MTTKEWLKRGRRLNYEIEQLKIAKQKAFELACGGAVDTSNEKVQGNNDNGTERKFISYVAYEEIIDKRIDQLTQIKTEILEAINNVPGSAYRAVLIAYYVNCKAWEEIAEELHYSERTVHRIHGEAIKKVVAV